MHCFVIIYRHCIDVRSIINNSSTKTKTKPVQYEWSRFNLYLILTIVTQINNLSLRIDDKKFVIFSSNELLDLL